MKKLITFLAVYFAAMTSLTSAPVNLVTNGNFETGIQGWYPFNNSGTHTFALDASNPLVGSNSVKISITNGTSTGAIEENWRLGSRWRMSLVKDGRYLVHFKARASKNLKLVSMFQQNFANWASWGYVEWNLTTEVQSFDVVLNNSYGVGGYWAFVFYYGHLSTGDQVWIDDIYIEELVNETTGVLTDGNVCNGDFETDISNHLGNISGWQKFSTLPADMVFSTDNSTNITGDKSFKATSTSAGTEGWHSQLIWNFCPVVGMKYSIEFKAKATNPVNISAEIIDDWVGGRNNSLGFANFNITTNLETFTYDYPNAVTQYDLYTFIFWLGNLPSGQSIWIDDVKLYQKSDGDVINDLRMGIYNNALIKTVGSQIVIEMPDTAVVNVYNMKGLRLLTRSLQKGENFINSDQGVFIVQILQNNQIVKSEKILIH